MQTEAAENPYGLMAALEQGGIIAWAVFGLLVFMSLYSWFIIITKYLDQKKVLAEAAELEKKFWNASDLKTGAAKLEKNSPFRQIVDDGLRASDHHEGRLTDKIDQHEWVTMALNRSVGLINGKLTTGFSFLASVGSTSPFVGLFGTVVGIYRALINIGLAGQASIDKVAGPVGEALIMTAIGLFVAIPAVLAYNAFNRVQRLILADLDGFAHDLHVYFTLGGPLNAPRSTANGGVA